MSKTKSIYSYKIVSVLRPSSMCKKKREGTGVLSDILLQAWDGVASGWRAQNRLHNSLFCAAPRNIAVSHWAFVHYVLQQSRPSENSSPRCKIQLKHYAYPLSHVTRNVAHWHQTIDILSTIRPSFRFSEVSRNESSYKHVVTGDSIQFGVWVCDQFHIHAAPQRLYLWYTVTVSFIVVTVRCKE